MASLHQGVSKLNSKAALRGALIVLLTLAVGGGLARWAACTAEQRLRADKLTEARMAAQAISAARVRSLSGTTEDLTNPDYERLKDQLAQIRGAAPDRRFLYLMRQQADGTVIFLVDSLPAHHPDYAAPGLAYDDIPDAYLPAFHTGKETIAGPVTDRWGTWMTALVPIRDPQTGELVAILGLDTEARGWTWEIVRQSFIPFTLMLVIALLILTILFQRQQSNARQELQERWRSLTETSPDIIFTVDRELRIAFANRAPPGYTVDELIGTPIHAYVEGASPEAVREVLERVMESGEDATVETTYRSPGGKVIHYESQLSPRRALGGDGAVGLTIIARDVGERLRAAEALRASESRVRRKLAAILSPDADLEVLDLADVIDVEVIQALMDDFYDLTRIGVSIIDLQGQVLVKTGWQDICSNFHRAHPQTRQRCIESDTQLSAGVPEGEYKLYRCKNNMWGMVTPVIIGGRHVGNLFLGQFFFDDEAVDRDAFREQARAYGFDEAAYLAALDRVPRWSREKVDAVFRFYSHLATIISRLSHTNLQLAREVGKTERLLEARRRSEQRFKSYIEHAPYGVFVVDERGRILEANERACRMAGYDAEQLLSMRISELAHSGHLPLVEQVLRRLVEGEASRGEISFPTADGRRWWSFSAVRIAEDRLLGYVEDTTERQEATRRLQETMDHFQAFLDHSPALVSTFDDESRYQFVNTALLEVLQMPREEVLGRPFPELLPAHVARRFVTRMEAVRETGRPVRAEDRLMLNGQERIYESILFLLSRGGDQSDLFGSIALDVTDSRQLKEQLRQHERLAAVGQLAGGMAHDFRNILGAITLYAQVPMRTQTLPAEVGEALETIIDEAARATRLVDQVRDFSRSAPIETQPVDLAALTAEALSLLRRTLPESIDIGERGTGSPCMIEADATRVHQILMNLALNARDAMPDGGELSMEVERVHFAPDDRMPLVSMPPGTWARLTISDTGTGMSEEAQRHLFEPFFTTKGEDGTGLGLAQVYGIVKQHGGFIDVDTALGCGTTFTVFLPVARGG